MDTIAFPHLGLTFHVDSTAFTLFGLEIKWYGIILTLGILVAFLILRYNAIHREHLPEDNLYTLTLITVPVAIIGARFVYVVTSWEEYRGDFWKIINIRGGGLAIYGGVIFGAIAILLYTHFAKFSVWKTLDAVAPGVMLAQAIGRWGNFVNMEAFGDYTDNLFAMRLPWNAVKDIVQSNPYQTNNLIEQNLVTVDGVTFAQVHPTFLYESMWNLVGVSLLLFLFYRKKKFDGEIFLLYLGWYGLGRTWIELLRTDSLPLPFFPSIKFSVFVGILSVLLCVIGMPLLYKRGKRKAEETIYSAKFQTAAVETVEMPEMSETVETTETSVEATESENEPQTADPETEQSNDRTDE